MGISIWDMWAMLGTRAHMGPLGNDKTSQHMYMEL